MNRDPHKPHFRRAVVDVELIGPAKSISTIALVDSGADYCLFNIAYAKAIGIDLEKCQKGRTIGIEGQGKEICMTDLEIQVKNLSKVTIPVGFIDSNSVIGLIGQTGFFDLHKIKFERDHNTFEINPVRK
jgi:hypothetical protein